MAAQDRFSKASAAARAARENRHLRRLIEDEQLRGNLLTAYGAARSAYGRINNGKPASKVLFEDRKLQSELAEAANALRDAAAALTAPVKARRRKKGLGRSLLLLIVAGVTALVLSEGLRSKLLDLMFGAEEEFDYSSPEPAPTSAPPAPEAVASPS